MCPTPEQCLFLRLRPIKAFRNAEQAVSSRRTQRHPDACTKAMACTVHACLVGHLGAVDRELLGPWMAWPETHRLHPRASSLPGLRGVLGTLLTEIDPRARKTPEHLERPLARMNSACASQETQLPNSEPPVRLPTRRSSSCQRGTLGRLLKRGKGTKSGCSGDEARKPLGRVRRP